MSARFVFFASALIVGSVLHEDTESSPAPNPLGRENESIITHLYVDKSVFNRDGTARIDIASAQRIALVDARLPRETKRLERLDAYGRPTVFAAQARGCCLFSVPELRPAELLTQLRANVVRAESVAVGSLIVEEGLGPLATGEQASGTGFARPPILVSTLAEARDLIRHNRGGTVILLGRLHGEDFVGRPANRRRDANYSIAGLHRYALRHDVALIAVALNREAGEARPSNPAGHVESVARWLNRAASQSNDLVDFFGDLVEPDLRAVAAARRLPGRVETASVLEVTILSNPKEIDEQRVAVASAYVLGRRAAG